MSILGNDAGSVANPPAGVSLIAEAMSYTYSAALRAAAALGVADRMSVARSSDVAELASAVGVQPDALRRILRLLAVRGIVTSRGPDRFALTRLGDALRTQADGSVRQAVLMLTDPLFWKPANVVADSARTQAPAFADIFGQTIPEYFAANSEKEDLFYAGMDEVSATEHDAVARVLTMPETGGVVVDVGGRYGDLLAAVLRAYPNHHGILIDVADEVSRHRLDVPELRGRWKVIEGDFFAELPSADMYLLKRIFHNWNDEQCLAILAACRAGMRPGGQAIIIDAIVPDGDAAHDGKNMDFMMLGALSGKERTAAELAALVTRGGFRLLDVISTETPMSLAVIEPA